MRPDTTAAPRVSQSPARDPGASTDPARRQTTRARPAQAPCRAPPRKSAAHPARAASVESRIAADSPAGPPPTIRTSTSSCSRSGTDGVRENHKGFEGPRVRRFGSVSVCITDRLGLARNRLVWVQGGPTVRAILSVTIVGGLAMSAYAQAPVPGRNWREHGTPCGDQLRREAPSAASPCWAARARDVGTGSHLGTRSQYSSYFELKRRRSSGSSTRTTAT